MFIRRFAASLLATAAVLATPAQAAGDLLVAPTRVVLEGSRGTEVILNNIGSEPATYRISLQLKRMNADGALDEVVQTDASEVETKALSMVSFAPRKVTLAPNQPQSIRIGIRAPAGLPDGEYRVHMLFRAIPAARPVSAEANVTSGFAIALNPIYGVSIPVIVRKGQLKAQAGMTNPMLETADGKAALVLSLTRTGGRSTYGRVRVLKPGVAKPVFEARGIAVYTDVEKRDVRIPVSPEEAAAMKGPVIVQYLEEPEAGGKVLVEVKTVIK